MVNLYLRTVGRKNKVSDATTKRLISVTGKHYRLNKFVPKGECRYATAISDRNISCKERIASLKEARLNSERLFRIYNLNTQLNLNVRVERLNITGSITLQYRHAHFSRTLFGIVLQQEASIRDMGRVRVLRIHVICSHKRAEMKMVYHLYHLHLQYDDSIQLKTKRKK